MIFANEAAVELDDEGAEEADELDNVIGIEEIGAIIKEERKVEGSEGVKETDPDVEEAEVANTVEEFSAVEAA